MLNRFLAEVRRQTIAITALVVAVLAAGITFGATAISPRAARLSPSAATDSARVEWAVASKTKPWFTSNPNGKEIAVSSKAVTFPDRRVRHLPVRHAVEPLRERGLRR